MSPSPDEPSSAPQPGTVAAPSAGQPLAAGTNPPQPSQPGASDEAVAKGSMADKQPEAPAVVASVQEPPPRNVLLYTVFGFLCMGIALWLVFAWSGYKEKYSQLTEGWHLGGTKMLEITLIREDRKNLACASDRIFAGTHCGYYANGQPFGGSGEVDANTLQPFNTIKNELFLGAGLWASPALAGNLPADRFTVVCNYRVVAVGKSLALRWSPSGAFNPVDQSVAIGTLADCVIPQ